MGTKPEDVHRAWDRIVINQGGVVVCRVVMSEMCDETVSLATISRRVRAPYPCAHTRHQHADAPRSRRRGAVPGARGLARGGEGSDRAVFKSSKHSNTHTYVKGAR